MINEMDRTVAVCKKGIISIWQFVWGKIAISYRLIEKIVSVHCQESYIPEDQEIFRGPKDVLRIS